MVEGGVNPAPKPLEADESDASHNDDGESVGAGRRPLGYCVDCFIVELQCISYGGGFQTACGGVQTRHLRFVQNAYRYDGIAYAGFGESELLNAAFPEGTTKAAR